MTPSELHEVPLIPELHQVLDSQFDSKPFPVVEDQVVGFLDHLGRIILRHDRARAFSDLMAFGFWCRRGNILNETRASVGTGLGVGSVLHIAPGNIPLLFGYSLALGLLAGNNNLVKLPSRELPQVDLLVEIIRDLSNSGEWSRVTRRISVLKISRDDQLLAKIVANVDGLIVWGGDKTAEAFRAMPKAPRCREVYFPDRKSAAFFDANSVVSLDEKGMEMLLRDFFNDTYQVDQNACSSPSTVIWIGESGSVRAAMARFWSGLDQFLRVSYRSSSTVGLEKILDVLSLVEEVGVPVQINHGSNLIFRFSEEVSRQGNLRFGQFYEASVKRLKDASQRLRGDEQTLTYFGFSPFELEPLIADGTLIVDRLCPVGTALNFGAIWDGKDVIGMLSRRIVVS